MCRGIVCWSSSPRLQVTRTVRVIGRFYRGSWRSSLHRKRSGRGRAYIRTANGRASSVSGMSNCSGGDRKYDKICIWEADSDITCDVVDGAALLADARRSVRTEGGGESGALLPPPSPAPRIAKWVSPPLAKQQGETIVK